MTWEQEIQLAAAEAAEKEREHYQKIVEEQAREIAELKAKLAEKSK